MIRSIILRGKRRSASEVLHSMELNLYEYIVLVNPFLFLSGSSVLAALAPQRLLFVLKKHEHNFIVFCAFPSGFSRNQPSANVATSL
jgi:hypothetical protein